MLFKRFAVACSALVAALLANALDLPVKYINNKAYYYYEVQPKETIYSLSNRFGISRDDIVKYNPAVEDGLKAYSILYFPVDEFPSEEAPAVIKHTVKKGESIYGLSKKYDVSIDKIIQANPSAKDGIKAGEVLTIPQGDSSSQRVATTSASDSSAAAAASSDKKKKSKASKASKKETVAVETSVPEEIPEVAVEEEDNTLDIAILLPFMLGEETPSKSALLYTDFYKGFLLAAEKSGRRGAQVRVYAYDTSNSIDTVNKILKLPELQKMEVIVSPENDAQLEKIASFCHDNGIYLFNVFAIKDERYKKEDRILQANIPSGMMYDKTMDGIIKYFGNDIPVFLMSEGVQEKEDGLTYALKKRYQKEGIEYMEITVNDSFSVSDLADLDVDSDYLFFPQSSSRTEFNKIVPALKSQKKASENLGHVKLFGYPEWTLFRGEALKNMHLLNTTIYTRFYDDSENFQRAEVANAFAKWYGTPMMETAPMQGLLGYDVGSYLIGALRANGGDFGKKNDPFDGTQCSFDFTAPDGSLGNVNQSLYFIDFLPDGTVKKINL